MLTADLDAARNLVTNGDFEAADPAPFFAFADGDDTTTTDPKIRNVATSFANIAVVDSTAGQVDSLAQDIATEAGEMYVLSFYLRGATNGTVTTSDTNTVEVLFDGDVVGEFNGTRRWQSFSVAVEASSETSRLEFREVSAASDGRGILIDGVALAAVNEVNVRNGSFENTVGDISDGATNDEVPHFFGLPNTDATIIGVTSSSDAADGDNVLDLNTSSLLVDRVFTNLRTEANSKYYVTFDLRNSTAGDDGNVRVRWDGGFAGSFNATDDWNTVSFFAEATGPFTTLLFRENQALGNSVQIDNVQLYRLESLSSDYVVDLNGGGPGTDNAVDHTENLRTELAENLSLTFTNGNVIRSATVRVQGYTGTEVLTVNTTNTQISSSFNVFTGIMRLVGRDTVENYEQVLQSLAFNDSNDDPRNTMRQVVVSVTDGTVGSERSTVDITVTPVNDAPTIENIADVQLDFEESPSTTVTARAADVDDNDSSLTFDISITGDTFIFGDSLPTVNSDGEVDLNVVTYGNAEITISAWDPGGEGAETTFAVDVPFTPPSGQIPGDFDPFSGERQLSRTDPSLRNGIYSDPPAMTIDTELNYQAILETADGDIVIDLFAAESPITVNNFVNLAEDGFYDGLTFHRVIEDFVAQGGDPTGLGVGGPGYEFEDELDNGLEFNGPGQLAMANSGPDTNGSQFFFTLNDNPTFVGEHTIFGEVVEGRDVLSQVNFVNNGVGEAEVIQRIRIVIV